MWDYFVLFWRSIKIWNRKKKEKLTKNNFGRRPCFNLSTKHSKKLMESNFIYFALKNLNYLTMSIGRGFFTKVKLNYESFVDAQIFFNISFAHILRSHF